MNRQKIRGKGRKVKGRVKEAGGVLTGERELEREGRFERMAGGVEEKLGEARHRAGRTLEEMGKKVKR
jgi:uncharacterized protein YjbJ (UPF0337 family)